MNSNENSYEDALIKVEDLVKWFPVGTWSLTGFLKKTRLFVKAVDGISFSIWKGENLGLIGESGCGKTTTGRLLLRLIDPTRGRVYFEGKNIFSSNKSEIRALRRKMQIIFQDPYDSLNPRMTVYDILAEPLKVHSLVKSKNEESEAVTKMLEDLKLTPPEDFILRYPHQLSGGQRQRIAIGRALIVRPRFVVADEPVSMLDVSIRAEILNLILHLKKKFNLTILFITHDLAVARHVCDRLAIMYLGKIVEIGPTESVINESLHPYTQALLMAVPDPDPSAKRSKIMINGEVPNPMNPPLGCRFHTRCPEALERCKKEEPQLVKMSEQHYVACHLYN